MIAHNKNFIAITATEPQQQLAAQAIAKLYSFPYINHSEQQKFAFVLLLAESGLMLKNMKQKDWKPLQVDFSKGSIGYRLRHIKSQKQLLLKATGVSPGSKTSILDLTAGLGCDGFIFYQLGFSVTLLERSPIVVALLQDGLYRALHARKCAANSIQLIHTDARLYLNQLDIKKLPDIIYLDPMYLRTHKSALAKKEMRLLRQIVGHDTDAAELLLLALNCAHKRVIVKRANGAACLTELKPQHSISGKKLRFDIYLTSTTLSN